MKLWLAVLVLFSSSAFAQDEPPDMTSQLSLDTPRHLLTVNPLPLLSGSVLVEYEHVFTPVLTVFVGPRFKLFNGLWGPPTGPGGGLRFGPRWFYLGTAPRGLFTHAVAEVDYFLAGAGYNGLSFNVGAGAGYTILIEPSYVFSVGLDLYLIQGGTLGGTFTVTGAFDPELRFAFGLTF